jgi:lipopolysaccharide transport system ATP-binding protein
VLGLTKREIDRRFDEIVEYAELEEFIDTPVQHYSSGMRVRLGFAVSAHMDPDVLLIDEVLAVGDRGFKAKCFNTIGDLLQDAAVVFVSHSMAQIVRVCSEVMVLERGQAEYVGNDIGNGVELYHNKFDTPDKKLVSDGRVDIVDVEVHADGQVARMSEDSRLNFRSGDDLTVIIKARVDPSLDRVDFGLVFWNQYFVPVLSTKSIFDDIKIPVKNGLLTAKVTIPKLWLSSGLHSFKVVVFDDQRRDRYASVDNAVTFNVQAREPFATGFIIPGEWSYDYS